MIDLDSVEWRSTRGIVAFIETALRDETQTIAQQLTTKEFERKVLDELQQKLHIKAYIVIHNGDLTSFWIFTIANEKTIWLKTVGKADYELFIRQL